MAKATRSRSRAVQVSRKPAGDLGFTEPTSTTAQMVDPKTGEIKTVEVHNDIAFYQQKLTKKKSVTLTVLSLADNSVVIVKFLDEIREGKVLQKDRKPAAIARVEWRGQEKILVCGTIVEKELKANYANDSYVGKTFCIKKYPRAIDAKGKAKDYNTYDIAEIEPPKVIDVEPEEPAKAAE